MILMLDSSTPTCRLTVIDGDSWHESEWEAGRQLARGLLGFLEQTLAERNIDWTDLTGLAVMQGPGSFTGLRIGLTVMNTLASSLSIPIVACQGEDWKTQAISRLQGDQDDQLALPYYGAEANITKPRK